MQAGEHRNDEYQVKDGRIQHMCKILICAQQLMRPVDKGHCSNKQQTIKIIILHLLTCGKDRRKRI